MSFKFVCLVIQTSKLKTQNFSGGVDRAAREHAQPPEQRLLVRAKQLFRQALERRVRETVASPLDLREELSWLLGSMNA